MRGVPDAVHESPLDEDSQHEQRPGGEREAEGGIEAQARGQEPREVHAPDHHVPVGEVDDRITPKISVRPTAIRL